MNCARSFRGDWDERAVGFGLISSAYLIRITRHDHRARPKSGCVTVAIANVRSIAHIQTNPGQVPDQEKQQAFFHTCSLIKIGFLLAELRLSLICQHLQMSLCCHHTGEKLNDIWFQGSQKYLKWPLHTSWWMYKNIKFVNFWLIKDHGTVTLNNVIHRSCCE